MTKEQEAIDYVQKQIDYFKKQIKFIEAVDRTYYEAEYKLYKNRVKQFETVLNMLKEKDAEIEKKDKMIDLIIDFFYKLTQESPGTTIHYLEKNGFDTSKCNNCSPGNDCRKCFKQHFERKLEYGR